MERVLKAIGIAWVIVLARSIPRITVDSFSLFLTTSSLLRITDWVLLVCVFFGGAIVAWGDGKRGWLFGAIVGFVSVAILSFGHTITLLLSLNFSTGTTFDTLLGRGMFIYVPIILCSTLGGWLSQKLSKRKQTAAASK